MIRRLIDIFKEVFAVLAHRSPPDPVPRPRRRPLTRDTRVDNLKYICVRGKMVHVDMEESDHYHMDEPYLFIIRKQFIKIYDDGTPFFNEKADKTGSLMLGNYDPLGNYGPNPNVNSDAKFQFLS